MTSCLNFISLMLYCFQQCHLITSGSGVVTYVYSNSHNMRMSLGAHCQLCCLCLPSHQLPTRHNKNFFGCLRFITDKRNDLCYPWNSWKITNYIKCKWVLHKRKKRIIIYSLILPQPTVSYLRGRQSNKIGTRLEGESNEGLHERCDMEICANRMKHGVVKRVKRNTMKWLACIEGMKSERFAKKGLGEWNRGS